jgi:prephenate dehydratase
VSDLRGRLRRGAQRARRARHDPDRQFGGRPGGGHPSPDAEVGLHIVAEWFLPVQHQLMAPKGATLRRSRRSRATSTRSASAATSSASSASRRSSPPIPRARRAKWRKPATCSTRAALATTLAAKIYGLKILKKDVADAKHNTTRFVVLARKPKWASRKEKRVITTFVFQVRNIPAALYKALGGFATNGVNMTKLESYMVDGSFAATQFYADVQGHPKDRALELALEELEFVSQPKIAEDSRRLSGARFRETFK